MTHGCRLLLLMPPSPPLDPVLPLLDNLFALELGSAAPAQVQHIVLTADIQLQAPNWQRSDPSRPAVTVAAGRNIKLDSEPPYNSLDFAFLGSGWLKMAPNTYLTFSELVVEQSRCATCLARCGHATAIVADFSSISRLHACSCASGQPLPYPLPVLAGCTQVRGGHAV